MTLDNLNNNFEKGFWYLALPFFTIPMMFVNQDFASQKNCVLYVTLPPIRIFPLHIPKVCIHIAQPSPVVLDQPVSNHLLPRLDLETPAATRTFQVQWSPPIYRHDCYNARETHGHTMAISDSSIVTNSEQMKKKKLNKLYYIQITRMN